MSEVSVTDSVKKASGWGIAFDILIILAGFFSLALPLFTGIGITILIGWILTISGVLHIIDAFHARGVGQVLWRLLIGIVYIIVGLDLIFVPLRGLVTLTLFLGIVFLVLGVIGVFGFIRHFRQAGGAWILINALITLLLAFIILREGPRAAVWVIGTLVGIHLIFSGFTRLMIWGAVRKNLTSATA
jgi:uncharacterized membrane protein HdeD (DUF308 family)